MHTNAPRRRWAAVVAGLALVVTACGGGDSGLPSPDPAGADDDAAGDGPALADADPSDQALELARFFGDCDDSTQGVTDVAQATSECEVIQILTNQFNAENDDGISVERLGGSEWGTYYDTLNTTFAGGSQPDIAVMHGSNLPEYVGRDLLLPLDDHLEVVGIDPSDWTDAARDAVTGDDGRIYGVPFDIHANLFHLNLDILEEAGLVDDAGDPILPTSTDELFDHAQRVEDAGYRYFATDASQFPIGVRILFSLVWQQGSDLVSSDGVATVDTDEAREALTLLNRLFDEGYAGAREDYTAAQEAFLTGQVAVLHNGTWAVDEYNRGASFTYRVADFPTLYGEPAVWANSHLWVLPRQSDEDAAAYRAGLEFLGFLHAHTGDWAAGTGHLAPNVSALESDQVQSAPQRVNYEATATEIARPVPAIPNWQAVEDILKEEFEATWLTGKDVDRALADAQSRVDEVLD
jgi:multiple sugar transport system substrate-binding protein